MKKKGKMFSISQDFCIDRDELVDVREKHHIPDQSQSKPQISVSVGVQSVLHSNFKYLKVM